MDIVWDIDGTLANGEQRQHFLDKQPRDWYGWNKALAGDTPHKDIIDLFKLYSNAPDHHRINIATGRNDDDREETVKWLEKHGIFSVARFNSLTDDDIGLVDDDYFPLGVYYNLYMRADKDYREDSIIKIEYLDQMRAAGFNPVLAVDDRTRVVKAWRAAGLRCLQVRDGDF
jgi:hypothetical protein